ncbi:MAG: dockerin type I repeat-containing protein [Phycisphaerales bacterium]|nr:dockerin type I repeat-containing protein [Phycisphaerales bacterium]
MNAKNKRESVRALGRRLSRWAACVMLMLPAGIAAADGTNTYKFTNNEGEHAHDLHIKFDSAVSWDITDATYGWQNPAGTFKSALGSGGTKIDMVEGVGGTGVAAGASLELTFAFTGGNFPQVESWYWTKEDGSILGKEKKPPKKQIKFEYVSAQGGGLYDIWAHGQHMIFQTLPGEPSQMTSVRLAAMINDALLYGRANFTPSDGAVLFQGTAFGLECDDYGVRVLQQDRAGPMSVVSIIDCPGDLNGDGQVDFADYLEFLNLYDAGDPAADLNEDGEVDFADYLEFLNLYNEGCPEPQPPCEG